MTSIVAQSGYVSASATDLFPLFSVEWSLVHDMGLPVARSNLLRLVSVSVMHPVFTHSPDLPFVGKRDERECSCMPEKEGRV